MVLQSALDPSTPMEILHVCFTKSTGTFKTIIAANEIRGSCYGHAGTPPTRSQLDTCTIRSMLVDRRRAWISTERLHDYVRFRSIEDLVEFCSRKPCRDQLFANKQLAGCAGRVTSAPSRRCYPKLTKALPAKALALGREVERLVSRVTAVGAIRYVTGTKYTVQ